MNKIKKCLAVLVCAAMALAAMPGVALAETNGQTHDGFTYTLYDDHAEITGYSGEATELVIPAEIEGLPVTSIGNSAFYRRDSLESVKIPDSVTAIGDDAFRECKTLSEIDLPDGLTDIGNRILSFTPIYYDDANWDSNVFYVGKYLLDWSSSEVDSWGFKGRPQPEDGVCVVKPGTVVIADMGLWNNNFSKIVLPDSLVFIGDEAFDDSSELKKINIPKNLSYIGDGAFKSSHYINFAVDPENAHFTVDDHALYNKEKTEIICCQYNATKYTVPDTVTKVHPNALANASFTVIEFPDKNIEIEGDDGSICIVIGSAGSSVEDWANTEFVEKGTEELGGILDSGVSWSFDLNTLKLTVSGAGEVTSYPWLRFSRAVKDVVIEEGVTDLGSRFFDDMSLGTINIPASVKNAGDFTYCDMTGFNVAPDNPAYTSVDGVIFNKDMSELIKYPTHGPKTVYYIPEGVTVNGDFWNTTNLKTIVIPDTLTEVHELEFHGASFENLVLPANFKVFGYLAFKGCRNFKNIYFLGSEAEWQNVVHEYDINDIDNKNIYFVDGVPEELAATPDTVNVKVNEGDFIYFDTLPTVIDGTTMLPVRYALEPLGAEFVWDGENQTVTITAKGKTIVLTIDSATALVDGVEKTMAQPAMAIDGRTLIPIRFVSEELGYDVQWDGETNTVIING